MTLDEIRRLDECLAGCVETPKNAVAKIELPLLREWLEYANGQIYKPRSLRAMMRAAQRRIDKTVSDYCQRCGATLTVADGEAGHCTQCQTPLKGRIRCERQLVRNVTRAAKILTLAALVENVQGVRLKQPMSEGRRNE